MSARRYSTSENGSYDILLIDPEPTDSSEFIDSLEKTTRTNTVTVVSTGSDALDVINQRGNHATTPRPDLVLLDLQLPDIDGADILAELKETPEMRPIPVLVVTASEAVEDVSRSYDLHANAYLRKPESPDELEQFAQVIEDFWLGTAHLPPEKG